MIDLLSFRHKFKRDIEHPVKNGSPRGILRLQTLIEAVCLRRTKQDEINGKPLVTLPPKVVTVKELDFTDEERKVYDAYHHKAQHIIEKYMKKGALLKNYAHVFAMMMRLRQLCCHRELLPINWRDMNMEEIAQLVKLAINVYCFKNWPLGGIEFVCCDYQLNLKHSKSKQINWQWLQIKTNVL